MVKSGIYFWKSYLFDVRNPEKSDTFDVDAYMLHKEEGKTSKTTHQVTEKKWKEVMPFKAAIHVDNDTMQGIILGIFGEEF